MTLWNPEYRIKVNGSTVTSATLAGMTITSGRTDIYSQPYAGYCNLQLLETTLGSIPYDINDAVSVEVKKTNGSYVFLFGGFITDVEIRVNSAGSSATTQFVSIIAVGALARLARATFDGNISSDQDGDQIAAILGTVLFDTWNEVPAATTWNTYDPSITWENAQNSGYGEIDQPGDYELDSQNNVLDSVYNVVSQIATSGLGYIYEDAEGRIGYADSTHRGQYLTANGYVDLDGRHCLAPGLSIAKRAGNVRNSITISYGSAGNASVTDSDPDSIANYGELAASIRTTLKNQSDAQAQAAFYLDIRSNPQFEMAQITFPLGSPEIDNADRDALLQVSMALPLNIQNLPGNMTNGEYQGFVEGWTWQAGYNALSLTLYLSPVAYSLQAFAWDDVPVNETWQTINQTMTWLQATIVS